MRVVIRGTRWPYPFYVKSAEEYLYFIASVSVMTNTGGETCHIIGLSHCEIYQHVCQLTHHNTVLRTNLHPFRPHGPFQVTVRTVPFPILQTRFTLFFFLSYFFEALIFNANSKTMVRSYRPSHIVRKNTIAGIQGINGFNFYYVFFFFLVKHAKLRKEILLNIIS